jgi:hypothetical protein
MMMTMTSRTDIAVTETMLVYCEGNFYVHRLISNNNNGTRRSKPIAIVVDSIFVDGAFSNYATGFLNLLIERFDVFLAGWNNNIDHKTRQFGINEYTKCFANGLEFVKQYSSRDEIKLLVAYSSGLAIALYASSMNTLKIKNIALIGTPYSFIKVPWAEQYANYRNVFEDYLILNGFRQGIIRGYDLDHRFQWMDRTYYYTDVMGKNSENLQMNNTSLSFNHLDMPIRAYNDWMNIVRYNSIESEGLRFENEDIDCAVILYGYKDYLTNHSLSVLPLLTRLSTRANISLASIGCNFSHRDLLGTGAERHHRSMLDFYRRI